MIKPDEKTPLSLIHLARIALECGVPPGVFNIVTGDGPEVGARLASHPDVGKIAFTGSTEVGREIMRLASGTVKKVSLELGGKGPVVVLDDADLDAAVDAALFGSWLYCGQMCESGTRLLLPDSLHDEFVERMIERAKTVKVGDPTDFDTDLGPVVSAEQRDRVLDYLAIGVAEGATVAFGGGSPQGREFERGFWVNPTIFTDVRNDMRIAQEEIFGPVLSVIRYSDDEEAIRIANDTPYGLSAAVWSSDYERALSVARPDPGRHRVGQRRAHGQPGAAVRRLQAERPRPRARAARARRVHRDQARPRRPDPEARVTAVRPTAVRAAGVERLKCGDRSRQGADRDRAAADRIVGAGPDRRRARRHR